MFQVEANNNRSILDYLNGDCWCIVLDYVPILDIIRTERTNRRWQRAVLIYLQGVRFHITSVEEEDDEQKQTYIESPTNSCSLRLLRCSLSHKYYESFTSWLNKLGPFVAVTYCKDLESLEIIRAKCPNLEALTLLHMYDLPLSRDELIQHCLKEDFKYLKKLCFYGSYASDDFISQLIGERALEELEFHSCYDVTGQCLNNIEKISNLKSLVFNICYSLQSKYILTSINDLKDLTKLVLNDVPREICFEIHLMLDKMDKLEWLEINQTIGCIYSQASINQADLLNFEPLCRLSRLKHLSIGSLVTDNAVEAITECCKDLTSLEFSNCVALSSQAVEAICLKSGMRLTRLKLYACYSLNDDDVVACISCCPKLICLTVNGPLITHVLPARASAARHDLRLGQRLRLVISGGNLFYGEMQEDSEDLIVELDYN